MVGLNMISSGSLIVAKSWKENINKLKNHPSSNSTFLKNNNSYNFGETHKNINLANTLKSIMKNGAFITTYPAPIKKFKLRLGAQSSYVVKYFEVSNAVKTTSMHN